MPSPITWPHAPPHLLGESGTYFVTAACLGHAHHFRGAARLEVLQRGLLKLTAEYRWGLEAWAAFSNHYHFIARSPATEANATSLSAMLGELHEKTAKWVNRLDSAPGRNVWFNYWETQLTNQPSYLARLNYVHQNPVKHGLVEVASNYPWCSAAWIERVAPKSFVKTLRRFDFRRVQIDDEFEPAADW